MAYDNSSLSAHSDKRFKLDKPSGINLTSSNTRLIKATRTALEIIKASEKSIKNSKTGKMTSVVAIMKFLVRTLSIHGTLIPEKSIKSNNRLNSKKKHQNSAKLHEIGLDEPAKDASEGLIVK